MLSLKTLAPEVQRILYHPFASNSVMLASASYVSAGLNLLSTIIIARLLGPADYGVMALVIAYPSLVWSFVSIKSVSVTTRYIAGFRARREKQELASVVRLGYGLDFLVSAICFVLVVLTAWSVSLHFYRMPGLDWLMVIYAFSFPFYSLVGTSRAIFSSWQKFNWLAIFQVLESCCKLILVISFLFIGLGVKGVVSANAISHIIIGIAMAITATHFLLKEGISFWWRGSLSQIGLLRRELIGLLGWNYLLVTLNGFVEQLPLMLLGTLRGSGEAGFYRLATNIKSVGSYFEGSMGGVVYPTLSARWAKGERESLNRSLKRWMWKGGLPIGVLEALTIPFLPLVVPLVFGDGYKQAVLGGQILMGAAAIRALFFWLTPFYYASGKVSLWVKGFALYTILLIGFGWAGIQYSGFLGMVLVSGLVGLAFTFAMARLAFRREFSLT
jgi:O-antigen/teichoic acid export membrane protein